MSKGKERDVLVYKEFLPVDTVDLRKVQLPFETAEQARRAVLKVDLQRGVPCMWYQADLAAEEGGSRQEAEGSDSRLDAKESRPSKDFLIIAIGTGHNWKDSLSRDEYIGTLLIAQDALVLHYFLVDAPEKLEEAGDERSEQV